jgi:hypothetical protein
MAAHGLMALKQLGGLSINAVIKQKNLRKLNVPKDNVDVPNHDRRQEGTMVKSYLVVEEKILNLSKKNKRDHMKTAKYFYAIFGAASLLAAPNLFAAMSITMMDNTGLYSAGNGGEFRAMVSGVPVDWNSYSTLTSGTVSAGVDGGSWGYNPGLAGQQYFQTFCTELNEDFYPGATYNISSIGTAALYNNTGHPIPITMGVAYLYSQFAAGTLNGYNYALGPQRQTTWDLQNAIWDLLGEQNGSLASWVQVDLAAGLGNTGWTAAANGAYGVSDMVLDKPGLAQDQLVMTGPASPQTTPVPEPSTIFAGAMLLLPMGVSAVRILRKKSTV